MVAVKCGGRRKRRSTQKRWVPKKGGVDNGFSGHQQYFGNNAAAAAASRVKRRRQAIQALSTRLVGMFRELVHLSSRVVEVADVRWEMNMELVTLP